MINSDINNGGIYSAFIINYKETLKVYIPALYNSIETCPINSDGTLNEEVFLKCMDLYHDPMWCIPNLEATKCEQVHPCWVTFENGDINRAIIMGFLGKGIKYTIVTISAGSQGNGEGDVDDDGSGGIANGDVNTYLTSTGGSSAKEHGSGTGTQCVELPNHYIQMVHGINNHGGFGNGNQYANNLVAKHPDKFKSVSASSTLRPGDIISLAGSNRDYGHAAIVKSVNGNQVTILEQWKGSGTVRETTFNVNTGGNRQILSVARPK